VTGGTYIHLEKSEKLQKHIGVHLQNFSLLAFLDPQEDDDQDVDTMNVSEDRRSGSSLSSISLNFERLQVSVENEKQTIDKYLPEVFDNGVEWDAMFRPNTGLPEDDPKLVAFVERFRRLGCGVPQWVPFW
jgi:hypothetical protein